MKSNKTGNPEDLQLKGDGTKKLVKDAFTPPENFSTTPLVSEDSRKTGEISSASQKLRDAKTKAYPTSE